MLCVGLFEGGKCNVVNAAFFQFIPNWMIRDHGFCDYFADARISTDQKYTTSFLKAPFQFSAWSTESLLWFLD